ncbi:exonuclease domain-containing protein [Priestia koreensis]|uniref:Exonuclease n=1 Tax=Priestia koreensis TaxID=284581 RepID=A0A0M0L613_9BACI|nr:exonuclease domain-containing protein [Priestia koreensis]KOO46515.1 exonuclease [Priestia koreensis]
MTNDRKYAAIVDVETTGLSAYSSDIIELAAILFSYDPNTGEVFQVIDEYCGFQMPSAPINSHITRLTGITNEMVHNQHLDDDKIRDIFRSASGIIAHNASFDRSFLIQRYPELADKPWHCSMRSVKWKEYGFFNKKLTTLLDGHNISREHAHRALDDVQATLDLLQKKNPSGQPYLFEVMKRKMGKPASSKPKASYSRRSY